MTWYSAVALYAEYQKKSAATTAPYSVLPAYVYRAGDEMKEVPDSGALHVATRGAYREQVLAGMPMGDDWYLRAFPVWFARRGNFGILLSQAKALSTVSRLRGDSAGLDLAQRQAQWIVGRNPFAQSTMYGEGYDWAQQYSVSSGDFVGSLPVGMQSRGTTDLPYWPSAEHVRLQGSVGASVESLAVADGGSRRRCSASSARSRPPGVADCRCGRRHHHSSHSEWSRATHLRASVGQSRRS